MVQSNLHIKEKQASITPASQFILERHRDLFLVRTIPESAATALNKAEIKHYI
jgi:hypothetical protein